jgi:UDP-N-acetylmuramate: L-alanyl-gamma-D-glutamyl-meso-diaminopimelate ligase
MRMGVHNQSLAASLELADLVRLFAPTDLGWDPAPYFESLEGRASVFERVDDIVTRVAAEAGAGDQILVMSNGGFGGIHQKLLDALAATA